MDFYQVNQIMPMEPNDHAAGVIEAYIKSTFFSEYFHVAYQIKGNEAYYNMLANIYPLYTHTIDPWGGVKRSFFSESSHVHIKLMGMKHRTPCKQMLCPFTHPLSLDWVKRSKQFFSEEGHVANQTTRKEV